MKLWKTKGIILFLATVLFMGCQGGNISPTDREGVIIAMGTTSEPEAGFDEAVA